VDSEKDVGREQLMEKVEALDTIRETWQDKNLNLGEKITRISSAFYSAGLDLSSTAAHIHATPSELDALLQLGEFDDGIINEIADVNPPKATWQMLANSNDEEIHYALASLRSNKAAEPSKRVHTPMSEYLYSVIVDVSGPSTEQLVSDLSADTLVAIRKKAEDYQAIPDKEVKFLKSIAGQKRRGKALSQKQVSWLISILNRLADAGVISHCSIDGDQAMCDEVLKAIGR
jgi:hypothetical protein